MASSNTFSHYKVGDIVKYVGYKNMGSGVAGLITKIEGQHIFITWFHKNSKSEVHVSAEFIEKISEQ